MIDVASVYAALIEAEMQKRKRREAYESIKVEMLRRGYGGASYRVIDGEFTVVEDTPKLLTDRRETNGE